MVQEWGLKLLGTAATMQHTELGECCVVQPAVPAARLELPKCQRHFKAPAKSEIRFCHSFSGFFWVTGKMLICLWQKADRDTRLPDLCRNNPLSHEDLACRSDDDWSSIHSVRALTVLVPVLVCPQMLQKGL